MLSEQQKRFYDLFGYLVIPGLLANAIEDITTEFDAKFARHSDAEGQVPSFLNNFIDDNERLRSLLDDARIDGIAADLLGDDYNYLFSYGTRFGGDSDWHPNQEPEPYPYLLIGMYLDSVGADTGALRAIPGSHKDGAYRDDVQRIIAGPRTRHLDEVDARDVDAVAEVLTAEISAYTQRSPLDPRQDPSSYTQTLGLAGPEVPAAVLATEPGDVIVFNERTIHSAWGGTGRIRRQLRLGFAGHCPDEHLPALQKHITWTMTIPHWRDHAYKEHVYDEALIATAGEQRMRHLVQAISVEDQLPKVVQRIRELVPESLQAPNWRFSK
jgi:ectoine hydroxylase-related dioxygenase (phytanoyl-CoA dioxygenase family)